MPISLAALHLPVLARTNQRYLMPPQVMFARAAPHLTPQESRSTHASRASLPGRPELTATM
jgi:hypothetical protein